MWMMAFDHLSRRLWWITTVSQNTNETKRRETRTSMWASKMHTMRAMMPQWTWYSMRRILASRNAACACLSAKVNCWTYDLLSTIQELRSSTMSCHDRPQLNRFISVVTSMKSTSVQSASSGTVTEITNLKMKILRKRIYLPARTQ